MDDIMIYVDWESHLKHLKEILHRLSEANLTVKMKRVLDYTYIVDELQVHKVALS